MNALNTLLHAYQSIAQAHPDKDAFQIVADIEDLAKRIVSAAQVVDSALVANAAAPSE